MNFEKRILHLGLGRFHRGHQAIYYQKMTELGDARWGVTSMSMRSPEARDQMRSVNLRYPVLELNAEESKLTWVESIQMAYSAHEDFEEIMKAFLDPKLEIITLTITEKGYDLDSSGKLDLAKSNILQDLANPERPESAIGLLSLGLHQRFMAGRNPLTVISCDNVRDNGRKLHAAVESYSFKAGWDDGLWISQKVKFPNTMVDRIVPSLLPEKITALEKEFSLPTHSELIATEKFCQWVIENHFSMERPAWEKAGVQFVDDVRPYEEMKLKLLNASHSYLAYAGLNKGLQFIHEAIADHELRSNVLKLYEEVTPLLEIPNNFDLAAYKKDLIKRFENFKLPHQLKQIAMDGSQKLPQRIFPSLIRTEDEGLSNQVLALTVKEWMKYCYSQFEKNILPDDPESKYMLSFFETRKWSEGMWSGKIFNPLSTFPLLREKLF